jgi:hypothetical protein
LKYIGVILPLPYSEGRGNKLTDALQNLARFRQCKVQLVRIH